MPSLTCLMGLAGAGKSTIVNQLAGDRVHVIDENFFERLDELQAAISAGKDCLTTEISLCLEEYREPLRRAFPRLAPGASLRWVCIENDLEKANRNCRRERPDKEPDSAAFHIKINRYCSPRYTYPEGAIVIPMWPYDGEPPNVMDILLSPVSN